MRKKSLIIAVIATLGISVCMGTAKTSFAAENNAITLESEDAFGDGSENTEEFSAGEGQEENAAAFQDEEDIADVGETEEIVDAGKANSEEDFVYKVYGADRYVEIQEYVGTSSEVVIPSTIKGYPVKVVDGLNKDIIRRLVMPNSVVTLKSGIGKNIEDVSLSESLTELPYACFCECKNLKYVKLPSKITNISNRAFEKSGIERIDFSGNLTGIGYGAFSGCLFEKFVVPETVQTIGSSAFSWCKNLKEIQLPKTLTKLNEDIFKGDSCLEKVNYLPDLQYIGGGAFTGTAISTITFSKTVERMENPIFENCQNLRYVVCRGNILAWWGSNITVFATSTELKNTPPDGDSYPIDSPINMKLIQNDDKVTLSWDEVSYIDGYKVYRSDSENGNYQQIADIADNTYIDTVDENQTYYYKVCIYYKFDGDVVEGNFSTIVNTDCVSIKECRYAYTGGIPVYTGSPINLNLKVTYGKQVLSEGKDYSIENYENNINAGTAYVIINGKGRFKGTAKVSFKIKPRNIAEADFTQINDMRYTGKAVEPDVEITYNALGLQRGTDYTVTYTDNISVGMASIICKGTGNFIGTKTQIFYIVGLDIPKPAKTTITSVTASGTSRIIIKWKKVKNVKGYEIYRKSQFDEKYRKIKTIGNGDITKYTDSGLNGGTKYTYKIRSYSTSDGEKQYSAYSSPKSRTTKVEKLYTGTYVYTEGRTEWFVRIYKSGGNYYAEVGRNRTLARSTYKLTNCKTNYYGAGGDWRIYIIGNGYNRIWVAYEYGDNDEDYVSYNRRSW